MSSVSTSFLQRAKKVFVKAKTTLDGNANPDRKCQNKEGEKITLFFFLYRGIFSRPLTNYRTVGEGKGISLTPHYHFHPLYRYLDIGQAVTAESSTLHIGRSWTRIGNIWFPAQVANH